MRIVSSPPANAPRLRPASSEALAAATADVLTKSRREDLLEDVGGMNGVLRVALA
jgi:hypothetical protein